MDFTLAHEGEVRRDLLTSGFRLDEVGAEGLSWPDFVAFVQHAPEGTAIYRAFFTDTDHPEDAEWSLSNMLLAAVADGLAVLAWQNGGGSNSNRPVPIPRPGSRPVKAWDASVVEIDALNELLGIPDLF